MTQEDLTTVNAILKPAGLSINGALLTEAPPLEELLTAIGASPYREKELHEQGKLWRKFVILDHLGIYLLYDFEIERVIDVHFCFGSSKSLSCPTVLFSGLLFVNGVRLVSGMKEKSLPISGEFQFIKRGGWQASSNAVFVQMRTSRRD